MRIAYLISINDNAKSGLYYSIISKIKSFKKNNPVIDVVVFNMDVKRPYLIRKLALLFGIAKERDYPKLIKFEDLECHNVYFEYNLLTYLKMKLNRNFDFNKEFAKQKSNIFENFSLISAHYTAPVITAYYINKLNKIPYTSTFHGSDINITPFKSSENLAFYSDVLKSSVANFFVSKTLLKRSQEICDCSNNHVLYNGIEKLKFIRSNSEELERLRSMLDLKRNVVGFVGNFVDVKNVLLLPEIFQKILKLKHDVSFIVVGKGVLKDKMLESFKECGVKISFFDEVDRTEIYNYYSLMDVLVLPSKNEGLPLVLLEAINCGVKCVGSDSGGIPEVIGNENSYSLDEFFIENIANRVIKLIVDKSIKRPSLSKYNIDLIASKENIIYQESLKSNN